MRNLIFSFALFCLIFSFFPAIAIQGGTSGHGDTLIRGVTLPDLKVSTTPRGTKAAEAVANTAISLEMPKKLFETTGAGAAGDGKAAASAPTAAKAGESGTGGGAAGGGDKAAGLGNQNAQPPQPKAQEQQQQPQQNSKNQQQQQPNQAQTGSNFGSEAEARFREITKRIIRGEEAAQVAANALLKAGDIKGLQKAIKGDNDLLKDAVVKALGESGNTKLIDDVSVDLSKGEAGLVRVVRDLAKVREDLKAEAKERNAVVPAPNNTSK